MESQFSKWFKLPWLAVVTIFTCFILVLSHIPQQKIPEHEVLFRLDKVIHIISYSIIYFLALFSIKTTPTLRIKIIIFIFVLSLGYIDEYTQEFFGRTTSIFDWLADVMGAVLGLIFFEIMNRSCFLRNGYKPV